jgi:ABC-type sugar transport system ATPase subunit
MAVSDDDTGESGEPTTPGDDESAAGADADDGVIVRIDGVSKRYEGVQALDDVSLDIYENEVIALVGDNGAGKSTLVKSLAGVISTTSGRILVRQNGEREEQRLDDDNDAKAAGIEIVV